MRIGTSIGVVAALLVSCGWARAAEETTARQVNIGVVDSLFRDTPPSLVGLLSRPLKALMESQTGTTGDMGLAGDAVSLANKLKENKVQLGVFHGYEFAWARQRCPELKPLVIAIAHHRVLHAHLVVAKESKVNSAGDLKGKVIALPAISRGHLHLYLEQRCPAPGVDPKKFFSRVKRSASPEDALDDVIDDVAQAAIVDRQALDQYQQSNPERVRKLRVLAQSEPFPASVIAYYPGSLDESTLKRLKEGLINANSSPRARDLLKMCRITGFEEAPADYEQLLGEILKAYPRPLPAKEGK